MYRGDFALEDDQSRWRTGRGGMMDGDNRYNINSYGNYHSGYFGDMDWGNFSPNYNYHGNGRYDYYGRNSYDGRHSSPEYYGYDSRNPRDMDWGSFAPRRGYGYGGYGYDRNYDD